MSNTLSRNALCQASAVIALMTRKSLCPSKTFRAARTFDWWFELVRLEMLRHVTATDHLSTNVACLPWPNLVSVLPRLMSL